MAAQVESLEKLKAEEDAAKEKEKDKGKAVKGKPADPKNSVPASVTH